MASVVVSAAIHDLIRSPVRTARVVAVLRSAVYLQIGAQIGARVGARVGERRHRMVALLARDAVRVPIGVVTAVPRQEVPFHSVAVGDPAWIGDGELRLADGPRFQPLRYWDPRVPRLRAGLMTADVRHRPLLSADSSADPSAAMATDLLQQLPPELGERWAAATARLGSALVSVPGDRGDGGELRRAVRGLVGLGPGLTPAGDDVLAGALVTLAAAGDERRRRTLAADVGRTLSRTTPVSAALLDQACRGRSVPEMTALLRVLAGSGDLDGALVRLAGVGHTSGPALALGVHLALRAIAHRGLRRTA